MRARRTRSATTRIRIEPGLARRKRCCTRSSDWFIFWRSVFRMVFMGCWLSVVRGQSSLKSFAMSLRAMRVSACSFFGAREAEDVFHGLAIGESACGIVEADSDADHQ